MINDDINAIIQRGEERAVELNSKYEGLNSDYLNNFKSDATLQQWEGEDFGTGASTIKVPSTCLEAVHLIASLDC
jgi:SWI/SNF-related matrix-associated actin-dependent regulator of chromatin subfamily A member 5